MVTQIKRNNSINYMRLVCSFLVVAIHTNPFKEENILLSYIFTEIIPRIAVPFFFVISGYFYIKSLNNNDNNKKIFIKYLKRLLRIYIIWSSIYFIINFIKALEYGFTIKGFVVDCIYKFFWMGSYYHLWYFPAVIFCVIITTFFNKYNKLKFLYCISILLYIIGLLGCSYYNIGINIPIISNLYKLSTFEYIRRTFMMGVPFFLMGYIINKKENINKLNILFILSLILFVLEIFIVYKFNIQNNITVTIFLYLLVFCIFMICLKHPMYNFDKYSNSSKSLSGFIYYVHPIIILILVDILKLTQTATYFFTCLFSALLGLIIIKVNNKYLNKLL